MPTNKKEGLFFTTIMCFSMVLGMSFYNLLLHHDLHLVSLVVGLIPGFLVAFVLDVFVVGKVAKKIAFALPIKKDRPLALILTISTLMIIGMVSFMSVFGLVMNGEWPADFLPVYLQTWGLNFIVALPLQLLIVGPMSRKFLRNMQSRALVEDAE